MLILAEMIFADYQELVLRDYERKEAAGELSRRMVRLTSSKFKEECLVVCSQRYSRRDEKTLEEFFGPGGGDKVAWLKAIKDFDPDKFKPLINFIKRKTRHPDEKVVELLAWLINFEHRPHNSERRYPIISADVTAVKGDELAVGDDKKEKGERPEQVSEENGKSQGLDVATSGKSVLRERKRRIVIPVLLTAVAIAVIYFLWPKTSHDVLTGHQACMYWAGDHYEKIACNQKVGDTMVIPLDFEKFTHFKKITRPDTITENALGSIWYANLNGVYECYTSPGHHPIDTNLVLKPLRDYVLIRHIHGIQGVEKTSK